MGALGPTGGPGSWALSPVDGAGVGPMAAMGVTGGPVSPVEGAGVGVGAETAGATGDL